MSEIVIRPQSRVTSNLPFALFRRSIFDYLFRIGLATAEEAQDPPIASAWLRQESWVRHFWRTAAENWVAEGKDGQLLGWALSIERGGHLELTFFFVDPAARVGGLGRRLLDRAFSTRPETARTIMATQDAPALALYLRAGVQFVTTSVDIVIRATPAAPLTDITFRPIDPDGGDIARIAAIEDRVLGLRRDADLAFLAGNRPAGWRCVEANPSAMPLVRSPFHPAYRTRHPPAARWPRSILPTCLP